MQCKTFGKERWYENCNLSNVIEPRFGQSAGGMMSVWRGGSLSISQYSITRSTDVNWEKSNVTWGITLNLTLEKYLLASKWIQDWVLRFY